jgi:hypothetical protein
MKRKAILMFGIFLGFMGAFAIFSIASRYATSSESKPGKESMEECCKKENDKDASRNIDFESLPGQFFSTVLIN